MDRNEANLLELASLPMHLYAGAVNTEARTAAYSENWYPLADNPWTAAKFTQVRREAARHILALRRLAGEK